MIIEYQAGQNQAGAPKIRSQEMGVDSGPFRRGADGGILMVGDTTGFKVLGVDGDRGPWTIGPRGDVTKAVSEAG